MSWHHTDLGPDSTPAGGQVAASLYKSGRLILRLSSPPHSSNGVCRTFAMPAHVVSLSYVIVHFSSFPGFLHNPAVAQVNPRKISAEACWKDSTLQQQLQICV